MMIRTRAPLRLGLAGGGTDLAPFSLRHGGLVLNATIGLYAYAHLEESCDGAMRFEASDIACEETLPSAPYLSLTGPFALHKAVYNRIVRDFCGSCPLSVRLATQCDAPPGSGLGSSSTLTVAIAAAFAELLGLPLGLYDIAQLAWRTERQDLGLAGGKQDHFAACFGGFNGMAFSPCGHVTVNPLRLKPWIVAELESRLVLYYTGASRASADIIASQTSNLEAHDAASVAAMMALKGAAAQMMDALLAGDFAKFGALLAASWEAKQRTAASITNPTVQQAFAAAMDAGALAGKVSGAGGGGFCMFLADPAHKPRLLRALAGLQGYTIPCHFTLAGVETWRV
jgi:D-glycero-alpha-D-manno-heptose-7-phosphate kinase